MEARIENVHFPLWSLGLGLLLGFYRASHLILLSVSGLSARGGFGQGSGVHTVANLVDLQ